MPEKKLMKLIKEQGFSVVRTNKGHYQLINPDGSATPVTFAVGHGGNREMVNAPYVKRVLMAIGLELTWAH
jgi:predicted RNA binding protein YcfA (HicA-like mRNA interferase family)